MRVAEAVAMAPPAAIVPPFPPPDVVAPPGPRRGPRLLARARGAALAATAALLAASALLTVGRGTRDAGATGEAAAPLALPAAPTTTPVAPAAVGGAEAARLAYAGRGRGGVPNYVRRDFTEEERRRLRDVFGVDDPRRLTLPDSGDDAVLRYDARPAGCAGRCPRYPARVGLASVRDPLETWDTFAARMRAVRPARRGDWQRAADRTYRTLAALDPEARAAFERLVADARRAGFPVRVQETWRSPERQALILSRGSGRTFTATSTHAYGRAADLVVGDGRIERAETRRRWIAFRQWVRRYEDGAFRLIGTNAGTWDWPHVEYRGAAGGPLGYRTVDDLLAAAARCEAEAGGDARRAAALCTLRPHDPHGPRDGGERLAAAAPGEPAARPRAN